MKTTLKLLLAVSLAVSPGVVFAQEKNNLGKKPAGYLAPVAGIVKHADFCKGPGITDCDDTGFGIGGTAGVHANEVFAIEAAIVYLTGLEATFAVEDVAAKVETSQLILSAGPRVFLNISDDFALTGHGGGYLWRSEADVSGAVGGDASDNGVDFYLGAGARLNFTKNAGLSVDYTRYFGDDTSLGGRTYSDDVDFFSAQLVFRF